MKLIGGLGNQMFQYAAGFKIAHDLNTELKLDITSFASEGVTKRSFELDIFKISSKIASQQEINNLKFVAPALIKNSPKAIKLVEQLTGKSRVSELNFEAVKDNSYLEGNWNSEDYFKNAETLVRKEFQFKKANIALLAQIKGQTPISVHIRRGDYVNNPKVNHYYAHCTSKYYKKAMQIFKSKLKTPTFYFFSDDPDWVKSHFPKEKNVFFVKGNSGAEDLFLMSNCKHHIIANSSFSWWGAWLNKNKTKIVISPKKWFENESLNTDNLVPNSWIKI